MITPEMQKAFDDIWGSPTPNTSAQPYNVTRMEELRKIGEEADAKKSAQQDKQRMDAVVGGVAGERYKNVGQDIGQAAYSVFGGGEKMSDIQKQYLDNGNRLLELANKQTDPAMKLKYSKMASEMFSDSGKVPESVIGKVRSGEQVAGDFLGLGTDLALAGGGAEAIGNKLIPAVNNPILKGGAEALAGKTQLPGIGNAILRKGAEGAIKGATQFGAYGAGESAASSMQNNDSFSDVGKKTAVGAGVGAVGGAIVGAATGAAPEIYKSGKETVKNLFTGGRSEADILKTPLEEVSKLKPAERNFYFENQKQQIASQAEETTQKIKENLQKQIIANNEKAKELANQLGQASNKNVVELRPNAISLLSKQGQTFSDLIEEGMHGEEETLVSMDELAKYIDSHSSPEEAPALKQALGAKNTPEPLPGQQPFKPETKTLGEIYKQSKELKQGISKAAVKGSRVFTPADMNQQKAISMLTGFMEDNGVDFSEANKFWREWAPVRDQLVSEGQIFNQAGTKSETLASTMAKVAQGKDPGSAKFIETLEGHLGDINKENKAIASQLSEVQKTKLLNKLAAQEKILEAQMLKEEALKDLSSKQFDIERKSRIRAWLGKYLKTLLISIGGGVGGYEGVRIMGKVTNQ